MDADKAILPAKMDVSAETTIECNNSFEENPNINKTEINETPSVKTNEPVLLSHPQTNSLSLLAQYASSSESEYESNESDEESDSSTSDENGDNCVVTKNCVIMQNEEHKIASEKIDKYVTDGAYRLATSSSEAESSTDSDSDESESVTKADLDEFLKKSETKAKKGTIRSIGELGIEDLPPIEDLKITVSEEECVELGKVMSTVGQLVLVDSLPGTVPLNLDTILFLEKGHKTLGKVFDVLGNISNPIYCVRFNSSDEIEEKKIKVGTVVYVAPRTNYTSFVILSELMKDRGTDASNENDNEKSSDSEYSDDEKEHRAKAAKLGKNKVRMFNEQDSDKRRKSNFRNNRYQGNSSNYGHNVRGVQQYNNRNYSWHSNYQYPPNQMASSPGPFYPNPYAAAPYVQPYTMQQPLYPVPQMPPPPPPPPPPSQ